METRRLFLYFAIAAAVFFVYTSVYQWINPTPPAEQRPVATATQPTAGPTASAPAPSPATQAAPSSAPAQAASRPASEYRFVPADSIETFSLGGEADDKLRLDLTSRGAAIESIRLTEKKKNGEEFLFAEDAVTNAPYTVIRPVETATGWYSSFLTQKIWLSDQAFELNNLTWKVAERDSHKAAFTAMLRSDRDGSDRLRVTKTYTLTPKTGVAELRLKVENLGGEPFKLTVEQDGPVGVKREHVQYDMRKLVRALWDGEQVDGKAFGRRDLKAEKPLAAPTDTLLWTALSNKYFAVFMRPLPTSAERVDYVQKVIGRLAIADSPDTDIADMLAHYQTISKELAPGAAAEYAFEIYTGTKNSNDLEAANPAYADRTRIGYIVARDADQRCCCTFPWLTSFMTGLLETINYVVHNYGIAIMILVVIIRALLHPLTVFQQKSMYRMQEAQARVQPKVNAIKEKYANDKVKQNQETMKLYSEEGVNPAAGMIGMLPMMLQMPILIALWTAVNTDVHLRHAGFDPWWITDLSAPDQVFKFAGDGITIPVLGWLPVIGRMFQDIPSINLLPILMGISMWLQQKYMPKPGQQAKFDAAKKAASEKKKSHGGGMSPEEQMRQQQMISYMMSIMFPLMFYYMPSGLNLYWLSTNVFGIGESLIIRKQLAKEKERRDKDGPQPRKPKTGGMVSRFLKRMSEQAEELQRKADELAKDDSRRKGGPPDQRKR